MLLLNQILDPSKTGFEAETFESALRNLIVGQDEAVSEIVNIYQMYLTGMNTRERPVGSFLFLGPTGVGKTRIVEATAECLLKNNRSVIKIDCGEFQHSHEIAKLIGSPPGYLGHRETHPLLSQEVLDQFHTENVKITFILFDEIEKASDALWNLLLGILDKAKLTLGDNRRVDFSRTMIFMTSNTGAKEIGAILNPQMGFSGQHREKINDGEIDGKTRNKIGCSATDAARRKFPPEFLNRADKILVFKPLGTEQLRRVLDIELSMVQERVFNSAGMNSFMFTVTNSAKGYILEMGTDVRYGARPLKRMIERLLVHPMSNLIATDQVRGGDMLCIDLDEANSKLVFIKKAEGLSQHDIQIGAPFNLLASAVGATSP